MSATILSCEVFYMRRVVALLIGCSLISGAVVADTSDPGLKHPNTVHGVYQACTSAQPFAKGYCAGFVLGAIGEITRTHRLCFSPEGVSADQLIQAFEKWHDAHSEAWQEPSSDGARMTLTYTNKECTEVIVGGNGAVLSKESFPYTIVEVGPGFVVIDELKKGGISKLFLNGDSFYVEVKVGEYSYRDYFTRE